jgi:hypothetical protein
MPREYRHHGYTIRRTTTTTTVYLPRGPLGTCRPVLRSVYEIDAPDGHTAKRATERPWLTTLQECRDWINCMHS